MFLPDQKFFLREIFLIVVSVLSGVLAAFFMNLLYDANLFLAPLSTILFSMLLSFGWAVITIALLYKFQGVFEKYEPKIKQFLDKLSNLGKKAEEGKVAGAGQGMEEKP